jgi:hypothetical protein
MISCNTNSQRRDGRRKRRARMSQPYFEKSVRMRFTLPKWELGSLPGLSKLQNLIAGVKTPRIEAFFISLASYQTVDVENELA